MLSLAVVQLRNLGAAYTLTNAIFSNAELKHLETCPLNGQALVLFQGPGTESLVGALTQISLNDIVASSVIAEVNPEILQAYYSLTNCNPAKLLVIIESEFAGVLFEAAQMLLKQDLKIMDFRVPRSLGTRSHMILTGNKISDDLLIELKARNLQVTVVNDLSEKFSQFLSLDPQA